MVVVNVDGFENVDFFNTMGIDPDVVHITGLGFCCIVFMCLKRERAARFFLSCIKWGCFVISGNPSGVLKF